MVAVPLLGVVAELVAVREQLLDAQADGGSGARCSAVAAHPGATEGLGLGHTGCAPLPFPSLPLKSCPQQPGPGGALGCGAARLPPPPTHTPGPVAGQALAHPIPTSPSVHLPMGAEQPGPHPPHPHTCPWLTAGEALGRGAHTPGGLAVRAPQVARGGGGGGAEAGRAARGDGGTAGERLGQAAGGGRTQRGQRLMQHGAPRSRTTRGAGGAGGAG